MNPYTYYSEKLSESVTFDTNFEDMTDFSDDSLVACKGGVENVCLFNSESNETITIKDQCTSGGTKRTIFIPYPYRIPEEVRETYDQKGISLKPQNR